MRAGRIAVLGLLFATAAAATAAVMMQWQSEESPAPLVGDLVVEIPTGEARTVRALVVAPPGTGRRKGAVILLAGGHGNLGLELDGNLAWGARNQLVRTQRHYADRGFLTVLPDIAVEFKIGDGAVYDYRWSEAHAQDLAAIIAYAQKHATSVHLIGTSRAALSVMNLAGRVSLHPRPDTFVVTSGMLVETPTGQPSVERYVPNLGRIKEPVLMVFHSEDQCPYTPPSGSKLLSKSLTGARVVDVIGLTGGQKGAGDPCEALSAHGFLGLDDELVDTITGWLERVDPRAAKPPAR